MDERTSLRDLADLALHKSQFDNRLGSEERQGRIALIEYCESRVRDRIDSGRSADCDEYRTLLRFAGKAY